MKITGWLPQLDRISLRVMDPSKAPVRIHFRINIHWSSRRSQLRSYFVQIAQPEVDHPHLLGVAEMVARLRERAK